MAKKSAISNNKLAGIGGWLILFQIALWYYLLTALLLLTINNQYLRIEGIIGLCIVIPALILLYKRNKNMKFFAIASVWYSIIFSIILSIDNLDLILKSLFGFLGISVVWAIIWSIYFNKSKRVKNTFTK